MSSTTLIHHQNDNYHTFLFHQVNVGKGEPNMDIALQQAWDTGAHVIMIQKPWKMQKEGDFTTKSHPGFNSHRPIGETGVRPRAITFTRKGIAASQIISSSPGKTSDYYFVQLSGLTFANVYRAPGPSGTLEPLLRCSPEGPTVVGGDFNAVSRHWQPQVSRQYGNGDQIMEWAMSQELYLITVAGEPTHRDGNVLDLVWSNTYAEASASGEYNCTSDHITIVGSVRATRQSNLSGISEDLWVSDQNLDKFARYVLRTLPAIYWMSVFPSLVWLWPKAIWLGTTTLHTHEMGS